jgi:hypothetical protein
MNNFTRNTARWLMTAMVGVGALAAGARDAAAVHTLSAVFSNTNPSTSSCSTDPINGAPWAAVADGYAASQPSVTRCEIWASGATQTVPCPGDANAFDVAIMDVQRGNSVALGYGSWGSNAVTVTYPKAGCATLAAGAWGSN